MRAPHRIAIAASVVVAGLAVYSGTRGRAAEQAPRASEAVPAPAKASFAKIGIGACEDSKVETAKPATTSSDGSCSGPVGLASLALHDSRTYASTSYR